MAENEERTFRDPSGAKWVARLLTGAERSGSAGLPPEGISFHCLSHGEHWVLRGRDVSLPTSEAALQELLQKARREGSSR